MATVTRVQGIDVARGVALLGIFLVNAAMFGQPFGAIFEPVAPVNEGWASVAVFWFTKIFCEGKFYPLFSILFGAGLAMMFESARRDGRSFGWCYFRRLVILGSFGIAHVVLLWYGDILLIYSLIGLWMIFLGRCSARVLLSVAGGVYGFGVLMMLGFVALSSLGGSIEPVSKPMPAADTALEQYMAVLQDWNTTEPYDSRVIDIEREVNRNGPFLAAMVVRVFNYLFASVFTILVMFWVILPCFCLGAALAKAGYFHDSNSRWRRRLIWTGMIIGLPLSIASVVASQNLGSWWGHLFATAGMYVGGPLMGLMYLSAILLFVEAGKCSFVHRPLGRMGQMALTCYLLESLLMTAVMAHWGLAKFGDNTWFERFGWVLSIYLIILVFANLWMSRFQIGPLEWLWRFGTHLRKPKLQK
ncbi:MAG: DUF418 domain-containing protein [Planctomycetaceae bacterium]|nr:DUF418 domain-containing protein [Planctomycetaceae bacterium]